jgi:hypothetical protein
MQRTDHATTAGRGIAGEVATGSDSQRQIDDGCIGLRAGEQ